MSCRLQLAPLSRVQWRRLSRYSTISTQGTISRAQPIRITPPPPPQPRTTTSPYSAPSTPKEIDLEDPLKHLKRAEELFANEHGLFDKIQILSQQLKNPDLPVRIGLIHSHPSLLNTLLADPFASDQTWYEQILKRTTDSNNLFKHSSSFESTNQEYNVPSPFLDPSGAKRSYEFLEINDDMSANDGCHLYISFQDSTPFSISKWPVYNVTDVSTDTVDVVLSKDEISSQVSYQAVKLLTESPQNASIYTELQTKSNITQFIKLLESITESEVVITKLYNCVLKNLAEQNQAHSLTLDELNLRDQKIRKYIANWDEASHREFQTKFKPFVTEYEQRELPWWKLYYRVDDVQAILAAMLHQGLLNDSFKNYSYIKGQIDSFTSFETGEVNDFAERLAGLDHNELTTLKRKVIQNDLVELQNKAVKTLMTNFVGVQMPLLLVSIPGYVLYDFSFYSMAGLASLGFVVGFNNISKKWLKLVTQFKQDLFEKVRLGLLDVNKSLYDDWSVKYEQEKEQIMKRKRLIEALKSDLGM